MVKEEGGDFKAWWGTKHRLWFRTMRGVNLGGWFSQIDAILEKDPDAFDSPAAHIETFLGPKDFQRIRAWGFDHVRLPLDYFNVFDGPALEPVESVLLQLDRAIDEISAAGLDIILDLHKCPGNDFHAGCSEVQRLFTDPCQREDWKRVWETLAVRYGGRPNLLFELLNEPVAEDAADWDRVKDELAAHVRHLAPNVPLVIGSNRWNNPQELARLTPLPDRNAVYSFHFYAPLLFTHQSAPWLQGEVFRVKRSFPGEYLIPPGTNHRLILDDGHWDRSRLLKALEPVLRFRDQHQVRVACNEFGVYVGGAERASQLRWMRDFVSILNAYDIGFSYWNYKNLDFGLVSQGERAYSNLPQYQNPERLDQELVAILVG